MLINALSKAMGAGNISSVIIDKKGGFEVISEDKQLYIGYQGKGDELKVKEELCIYFVNLFVDMMQGLSEEHTIAYDAVKRVLQIKDKTKTIRFCVADPVLMLNKYLKKGAHILDVFKDKAKNKTFELPYEVIKEILRNMTILKDYNQYVTFIGDKSGVWFTVGEENAHQVRMRIADPVGEFSVSLVLGSLVKVLGQCATKATVTVVGSSDPVRIDDDEVVYALIPRGK